MENKLGYTEASGQENAPLWPVYLCFLVFGALIPFSKPQVQATTVLLSILLSLAIGLLAVKALIIVFKNGNKALVTESGAQFAREAVGSGMLFMIPFTVLAVLARLGLGWDAITPFASAAIMTAAAAAGTEVMKKGARGAKNVMLPSALAFLLSSGWMLLVSLLP